MTSEPDHQAITTIRMLALDGVEQAKSGHPGLPLGCAPLAYTVFMRHLRFDPTRPDWPNRDRFVLSAGHGSMLLYSLLNVFGYDLPLAELKRFRQWGSKTPGHPEHGLTPGVETTTGPLGQGIATASGMALASHLLAARLQDSQGPLIDYRVFTLVSDGDLMEGLSQEAASLAGHLQLGNLIAIYDCNHITIEGSTELAFTEDVGRRFEAYGWQVLHLEAVEDVEAIDAALIAATADPRPSLIVAHTHIGYLSPLHDSAKVHGSAMGAANQMETRKAYNWPLDASFLVPAEVRTYLKARAQWGQEQRLQWEARAAKTPGALDWYQRALRRQLPDGWDQALPTFSPADGPLATRIASGKVINAIAASLPELIGGAGDLAPSTETWIAQDAAVEPGTFSGGNLHFGVREHAMGAALNGLALSGLRPFGGTFLIFSDYMRPAIRLAALMEQPVIYVFTHDSIGLGEDGPTHQPIETLMSLRLIPGLVVIRPADANETVEAWRLALERTDGPTALLFCRQKLPIFDRQQMAKSQVRDGGYALIESAKPQIVLAASGSEVCIITEAAAELEKLHIATRVVSVPSFELLRARGPAAIAALFPPGVPSLSVEAGVTMGWQEFTNHHLGIDHFGASAPYEEIYQHFHLTAKDVVHQVRQILHRGD
ncbi:MAG: transketolase [Sulfobacillus sp.]